MFEKLLSYWKYGKTFSAIEVVSNNETKHFYQTTVKKKNDEFTDFQYSEGNSFHELSQELKSRQHCVLVINTDKVLIKEVETTSNINTLLSRAFPGLSIDNFYYQITATSDKSYVAVVNKSEVDSLLLDAKKAKFEVVAFSIGFDCVTNVLPLIKNDVIQTATYHLQTDGDNISSFQSSESTSLKYQIGDETIDSRWLLAVSGLFDYEKKKDIVHSNILEKTQALRINHSEKTFFRKTLIIGVAIFFVGTLFNLIWFSKSHSELQKLENDSEFISLQSKQAATRLKALKEKEKLVLSIINSGNSKSSMYVNNVVTNLPNSIVLSEFQYQPLKKSVRPNKSIEYDIGVIVIAGESADKSVFSNWLTTLEEESWIETVTVLDYGVSTKKMDEFKLNIKVEDDAEN